MILQSTYNKTIYAS